MRTRTDGLNKTQIDRLGTMYQYAGSGSPYYFHVDAPPYISEYKVCADEVHPRHPYEGGPFWLQKVSNTFTGGSGHWSGSMYEVSGSPYCYYYSGMYRAIPTSTCVLQADKRGVAETQGTIGWNRFKPTKPIVSLSQFLYELKDLPQLFQFGLRKFKDLGSDYLNVQFGWKPFLSDLRSWFNSVKKLDQQVAQFRRANGKLLKRGGVLYDEHTESSTGGTSVISPSNYLTQGSRRTTVSTRERCWFSGTFRYYIPGLDDPKWGKLRAIQELYDLKVTPALLWELMPFSWLIDWFSTIGPVISNLQDSITSNLVAHHAYCMLERTESTKVSDTATGWYREAPYGPTKYFSIKASYTGETTQKIRVVGSPFGFGLSWDFSQYQLSILAAFGMTKLK